MLVINHHLMPDWMWKLRWESPNFKIVKERMEGKTLMQQVDLVRPKSVIFGHHDDWMPGFSIPVNTQPIIAEIEKLPFDVVVIEPGYLEGTAILPL